MHSRVPPSAFTTSCAAAGLSIASPGGCWQGREPDFRIKLIVAIRACLRALQTAGAVV
jgi:hypothetical protein